MIMQYERLKQHPTVFLKMSGLRFHEFDALIDNVLPQFIQAEHERLQRLNRQRQIGGGRTPELDERDQILLTIIWLRLYPTHDMLGYLFGVSDSTVSRIIQRVLPILEQAGRDTMRMPDPGRKRRRNLDQILQDTPELYFPLTGYDLGQIDLRSQTSPMCRTVHTVMRLAGVEPFRCLSGRFSAPMSGYTLGQMRGDGCLFA